MVIGNLDVIIVIIGFFILVVFLFIWYNWYLPEREREIQEKIRGRKWKYPIGNHGDVSH